MEENDATTMVRVYRETVQRVPCTASSLSSTASFILVSPLRHLVLVYHGRESGAEDTMVANEIAKEYKSLEVCRSPKTQQQGRPTASAASSTEGKNEVLALSEGSLNTPGDIMNAFLEILWLTPEEYRFRCKCIPAAMKNSPKTLYIIERVDSGRSGKLKMRKISTTPPNRSGTVGLMPFPLFDRKKIALLVIGDPASGYQYDLWFGESVSKDQQSQAKQLVGSMLASSLPLGEGITRREKGLFDGVHYESPLRVQYQGYEDPAFRSHFDEQTNFYLRPERNPLVYIRDKPSGEMLCGEVSCVDMFSWVGWLGGHDERKSGSSSDRGGAAVAPPLSPPHGSRYPPATYPATPY
jgi:hypothetical protein